jgi:hypothetical protein
MTQPHWTELAETGLKRAIPAERVDSARSAIDLKIMLGAASLRRLPGFARDIYVFALFAGNTLRIVIEKGEAITVWHIGIQPDTGPTE